MHLQYGVCSASPYVRSSTAPAEPMKSLYSTDFTHKVVGFRGLRASSFWLLGSSVEPLGFRAMAFELLSASIEC